MTLPALPLTDRTLGEIVNDDSRAALVLERFGLDYCCGGQQTLAEASADSSLPLAPIVDALAALGAPDPDDADRRWTDLDALARHIIDRHHRYVREMIPAIDTWLAKLVSRHGKRHPELAVIWQTFSELSKELTSHMAKEETLLFPAISDLAAARRGSGRLPASPFGTVLHPVRAMEDEHRAAGELLGRLRTLTANYTPPDDACTTYRLCYGELQRFQADLVQHVHLENNVLFPRALELERQLA
jgi:regulator of cell morphogenesis and NO signaling